MNNQQAVPQNDLNVSANQTRPSSYLMNFVSLILKPVTGLVKIVLANTSVNTNGTSPSVTDGEEQVQTTGTNTYILALSLYPNDWLGENFLKHTSSNIAQNGSKAGPIINDYQAHLKSLALPVEGKTDNWRVLKIDVYINMIFCYIQLGDGYDTNGMTNNATKYMEKVVAQILPNKAPQPDFIWALLPWEKLGQPFESIEQNITVISGSAGGGAM